MFIVCDVYKSFIFIIDHVCSLVFNLGEYRRRATHKYKNHNFFRTDNEEAMRLRERCAMDALDDVCDWLDNSGGEVAVSWIWSFVIKINIVLLL